MDKIIKYLFIKSIFGFRLNLKCFHFLNLKAVPIYSCKETFYEIGKRTRRNYENYKVSYDRNIWGIRTYNSIKYL